MANRSKSQSKERRTTSDANETAQLLQIEETILKFDTEIMASLDVTRARPNTKQCIAILKRYRQQPITALMLKKHPHLVNSIERVRNYVGQIDMWKLTEYENDEFREHAAQIRESADDLYAKFQKLFPCQQDRPFAVIFANEVQRWQKHCKRFRIHGERLVTLTIDPMLSKNSNEFTQDEILATLNDSVVAKGSRNPSLEVELKLKTEIQLLENRCKLISASVNERQSEVDKIEREIHILNDERLQCFIKLYQKRNELIASYGDDWD